MTSIVIYFSRAGSNWVKDGVGHLDVGNTELLAKYIQKKTDCDIFKIETTKQYPDDYYQATEVAKEELQNALKKLFYSIGDMKNYKVELDSEQIEKLIEEDFIDNSNEKNSK